MLQEQTPCPMREHPRTIGLAHAGLPRSFWVSRSSSQLLLGLLGVLLFPLFLYHPRARTLTRSLHFLFFLALN